MKGEEKRKLKEENAANYLAVSVRLHPRPFCCLFLSVFAQRLREFGILGDFA